MRLYNWLDAHTALGNLGLGITRGFFGVDYFSLLGVDLSLLKLMTTWSCSNMRECPSTRHYGKWGPFRTASLLVVATLHFIKQGFPHLS